MFTRSGLAAAPAEVTATADDPATVLAGLHARGLRRARLKGGGALAGAFRRAGLIDDDIISVVPVALGTGTPLFVRGGMPQPLALVGARRYPNGAVQMRLGNETAVPDA